MADDGHLETVVTYYLWVVISPILLVLGTTGNIMSIIVMCRRSMRTSQASIYLIALSITDLMVLHMGLMRLFIRAVADLEIRHVSEAACKINTMLVYASLDISVWILVAFTFERILSVFTPYRVKHYCTRWSSIVVIGVIIVLLLGLNSHFLYGMGDFTFYFRNNQTHIVHCYYQTIEYYHFSKKQWPWIDFSVFSLVPFLILITGNTCIAVKVLIGRRKARRVGVAEMQATTVCQTVATSVTNRNGFNTPPRTLTKTDRTSSMTAILLILNLVFLVSTIPVSIFFIIEPSWTKRAKTPHDRALQALTFAIVNLIQYTNNSINFILYCITGSRFRKELKSLLLRKQNRRVFPAVPGMGHDQGARLQIPQFPRTTATSMLAPSPVGTGRYTNGELARSESGNGDTNV